MSNGDLFDDEFKEFFEERAAIREFEGGQDRVSAETAAMAETQAWMFVCEVRSICRMRDQKGLDHARSFLLKVETKRGADSANRLREAANEAWQKGERGNGESLSVRLGEIR